MQIVTANELYEIDRFTMDEIGLPGMLLMENAGQAFVQAAQAYLNKGDKIGVLIGTGNNGGDGFVITRVLKSLGYDVEAWLIPKREKITGDALFHLTALERSGYDVQPFSDVQCLQKYNVIIDAMLGIGLMGSLRSPYREIIAACNDLETVKLAVDIPSGVTADGNQPIELAFKANVTITLHLPKLSAFTYPARDYYGELKVVSIGIPPKASQTAEGIRKCWTKQDVRNTIPDRPFSSHKGDFGKGLIIGGSHSMSGAPIMTTKASLRAGGGLITLAIPDVIHSTVAGHVVESMFSPWPSQLGHFSGEIGLDLSKFNAIAFGPGLGRENGGEKILADLLDTFSAPVIIDADGLFALTSPKLKEKLKQRMAPAILTPHAGEMARLLNISVKEVEQNRFELSKQFAMEYGVFLVLKGPYSIVTTPSGHQYINTTGNPGLAKGGTGDVLTGIILAFVMSHSTIQAAVSNAVYVHGKAAEELVSRNHSLVDILATDVIDALPLVFRTFF